MTTTSARTTHPDTSAPRVTGRQPSEQAIDAAIDSASRLLRLPTMRDRYAEIAEAAGREQLSYRAFLAELLLAECDDRNARRAVRRVHEAGFPRPKTLDDFDFNANTAINPATINTLAGCGWISKGQSLCLIGDSGTGKSHLLIAPGHRRRPPRTPGPLRPGRQAGQRARRGRRRTPALPHHRPLR